MKLFSIPPRFSFTALLLLLLQLVQVQSGFAQAPLLKQWDYRFGGTGTDVISCILQTSDGGYILGGTSNSDNNGDKTQPSWGGQDYWIVKTDSLGNKQWDKNFGGIDPEYLYCIQQSSDGGYILGGFSYSGVSGDKTQSSWGGRDYWIVKTDSMGIKQWDKDFGGTYDDELLSICQTFDRGYILGGYSYSGIGGDKTQPLWGGTGDSDYWIIKTDSLGNKEWDKDLGGFSTERLYSIIQTTDDGFMLGGISSSGMNGDKTQPLWGGGTDYWIVKTDSLGNKLWDKDFGTTGSEWLNSIIQTDDGGYIIGGKTDSGISGDKTQQIWGGTDYWIIRIDSVGNKLWDKDFGGTYDEDEFGNISQTYDGGFLLAGISYSGISGDKTENNLGQEQTWIVKTDSLGNKQWDKTVFTLGHDELGFAIQTKDGCYVVASYNNAGIGGYKTQPAWNMSNDYWIVKFCDTTTFYSPSISLSSTDTTFCEKSCINFFDLSTNNPTSWKWHFPGASPDTSTLQNPTNICYNTYGTYNVTLVACNQFGCDSITFSNFITCYKNPVDSIYGANDTLWSTSAFSYQWYETTSGLISGATNQYYVPVQMGSYFCVVTDSNGCEAVSNTIVLTAVPPLSFGEGPGVRPNPATDFISVDFPFSKNQELFLEIFDVNGNIVIHQGIDDKNKINISSLAKGVYGYRIISNDKILQQGKLVKM